MTFEHTKDCRWFKLTADMCPYITTHHYCPHKEHACNCNGLHTGFLEGVAGEDIRKGQAVARDKDTGHFRLALPDDIER